MEGQYLEIKSKLAEKKNEHVKALLGSIEEEVNSSATALSKFEAVMLKMAEISESADKAEGLYC